VFLRTKVPLYLAVFFLFCVLRLTQSPRAMTWPECVELDCCRGISLHATRHARNVEVSSGRCLPTFQGCLLPPSGQRANKPLVVKSTRLLGSTARKTAEVFTHSTVRT
jgi:hypothetical protein